MSASNYDPVGEPPNKAAPNHSETEQNEANKVTQSIDPNGIESQPDDCIEFLHGLRPDGPWVLCAIPCESGSPNSRTFTVGEEEAMAKWIRSQNNDKRGIYYHVNDVRAGCGKALKSDVLKVTHFHVDVDPEKGKSIDEERVRILDMLQTLDILPEPTAVIYSGGGYQALWKLKEPIEVGGDVSKVEDAERYNIQIAKLLQADACHNADRIMRLPGSINWPNAAKRSNGQEPALARVEWADWDVSYDHADTALFLKAPTDRGSNRKAAPIKLDAVKSKKRFTAEELDNVLKDVESRARVGIVAGYDPDKPLDGANSRSEWVWHVCCAMVRGGVDDDSMYAILRDPDLKISEHIIAQGNEAAQHRAAGRAVQRARAKVEDGEQGGDLTAYEWGFRQSLGGVSLRYNEFTDRATIDGLPGFGPQLTDAAMMRLRMLLYENDTNEKKRLLSKEFLGDLCANEAQHNRFHPVRDYLDGLGWDGVSRVDTWMIDYLSVDDTPYVRAASRIFLVAAVRRIRSPGCKFDELPVLEGHQGGGKSTLLARLAVRPEWFSDDLPLNLDGKRIIEQTAGKWIIEFGEMNGMRKGEHRALKSMLSRGTDCGRMAYARMSVDAPRQWVGIGTTNDSGYLSDPTGNRRIWPIRTGAVDLAGFTPEIVGQLWAEAASLEVAGESIRLDRSLWTAAAAVQEERTTTDPFSEAIEAAVEQLPEGPAGVFGDDLWSIAGYRDQTKRTPALNGLLGAAMTRAGFKRLKMRRGDGPEWGYRRGPADGPKYAARFPGNAGKFTGWRDLNEPEASEPF